MTLDGDISFRAARREDAETVFNITKASIDGLARASYSRNQIENWMGERTPEFYEELIAKGRMTVCLRGGIVVGFVDAEPGEVTRLFILPEAAGAGLGRRLLEIGIVQARLGHNGPVRLEATINAEGFYQKHGFRSIGRGYFSHGRGGEPIEIVHMELRTSTSCCVCCDSTPDDRRLSHTPAFRPHGRYFELRLRGLRQVNTLDSNTLCRRGGGESTCAILAGDHIACLRDTTAQVFFLCSTLAPYDG